jgi:hypothetical protein
VVRVRVLVLVAHLMQHCTTRAAAVVVAVVPCVRVCHHRYRLIRTMAMMQVLMLMPKPILITTTTLACLLATMVGVLMLVVGVVLRVVLQCMRSRLKTARPHCTQKVRMLRGVEVVQCIPCPLKIVQMRPIHPLDALVRGAVDGSIDGDYFCAP